MQPSHSGTSGSPITFIAYPGETPILNGTYDPTYPQYAYCRVLATNGQDYIIFDGFTVQSDNGTYAGSIMVWGISPNISDFCIVRNCIVNGGSTKQETTNIGEGIRCDNGSGNLIQRNTIYNFRQTGDNHNTSAMKFYHNQNVDHPLTVENNEVYNCSNGIYNKSTNPGATFRYNFVHDCTAGYFQDAFISEAYNNGDTIIHDNVFANCTSFSLRIAASETANNDDVRIYNNTIYGASGADGYFMGVVQRLIFYNNIVQGCAGDQYTNAYYKTGMTLTEQDYNQFGTGSPLHISAYLYDPAYQHVYTSLASWQATTELIGGGHPDTHSLASDPLFVNGSGNLNTLTDFALQSGSPCKGTGKDGADMGADISLVGIQGEQTPDTTPPAAPQGLSVQ